MDSRSRYSSPDLVLTAKLARINNGALACFRPPEKLNIWQWAERHRFLAKGVSARSLEGAVLYSSADAPHQRKPQESCTDPNVQMTVLVMASQVGGKTEMCNNVIGYHMHHTPRSAVVMYPTLDAAKKYSKKKFTPMVEATPVLKELIRPSRSRDSGNTVLMKEFHGGSIFFVGANSATSLRGASGELLIGDEIDSNESSAGDEGDPVELLWKRGESFPRCVKLVASTPTTGARDEKGVCYSPIWALFELSDQQFWFVPCPKCGTFQKLTWKQVIWPAGAPEEAELLCSSCEIGLNDGQRQQMYYDGRWEATAPFNGICGFHLNGIYCPWPCHKGYRNRLHQMAEESIRAKRKGDFALRVWVNTFLTECWEERGEKLDHVPLLERAESYTLDNLPEEIVIVTAAVDVQKDRLECETIGLGMEDESWGIEKRVFQGDTEQDVVWQDLAEHLGRTYQRSDGVTLKITCTAVDTRHKPKKVFGFCHKFGVPRVYPVYGVAGGTYPILVTDRFNKRNRIRTYAINTKIAKDLLFARLRLSDPGPRYCHHPKGNGYTEAHYLQLTAEVLKTKRTRGFTTQFYEKIRERNEALDIRVYWLASLDILKPNLTRIAKNHKPGPASEQKEYVLEPAGLVQAKPAAVAKPKPPVHLPGNGFVNSWKK